MMNLNNSVNLNDLTLDTVTGGKTYTVHQGDTLSKLAKTFKTTIGRIMRDNPIIKDRNLIRIGWKLKV